MSKGTLMFLRCDAPDCKVRIPGTSSEGWPSLIFRSVQNGWRHITVTRAGYRQQQQDYCPDHTHLA